MNFKPQKICWTIENSTQRSIHILQVQQDTVCIHVSFTTARNFVILEREAVLMRLLRFSCSPCCRIGFAPGPLELGEVVKLEVRIQVAYRIKLHCRLVRAET